MKKLFILLILLIQINQTAYSQATWFKENAIWYYDYFSFWQGLGYEKMEYVSDSLINGKLCKKLNRDVYYVSHQTFDTVHYQKDSKFVYQSGDTIWHLYDNEFIQLYNFNLEIGDTVNFMNFSTLVNNVNIVEDIQMININNNNFKQQTIGVFNAGNLLTKITIVENIGITSGLFSFFWNQFSFGLADGPEWRFRCYSDINLSEVNYSNGACDELPKVVTTKNNHLEKLFVIYPNPASDIFYLGSSYQYNDVKVEIIDMNGKIWWKGVHNTAMSFSAYDFPAGVYVVQMNKDGRVLGMEKLVVVK